MTMGTGMGRAALALLAAGIATSAIGRTASDGPVSDRAGLLYENHCGGCHDSGMHSAAGRRSGSVEDVRKQVRRWSDHQSLGWSQDDVDDVTQLLVDRYYHFDATPLSSGGP